MHMPPSQVLLPTLFYLAVHVRASEAGEPPTSAGQLAACALVVLGGLLAMTSALGALLGELGMLIFLLLACILAGLLHSLWQAVNALQVHPRTAAPLHPCAPAALLHPCSTSAGRVAIFGGHGHLGGGGTQGAGAQVSHLVSRCASRTE